MTKRQKNVLELTVRVLSDGLMANMALLMGLAFSCVVEQGFRSSSLIPCVRMYLHSFGVLTAICLVIFYAMGFYTKGRAYSGRYKFLVIAQAIVLSYLTFALVNYLVGFSPIPRSGFVAAFVGTFVLIEAARLWMWIWRVIGQGEGKVLAKETDHQRSVLVIGGAGYIGSALLPKLLDRGYHVRLLDLFVYGQEPIANLIGHPNLEIVRADFRQIDKVVAAMEGMDAVIHLGAIVGDPACALNEKLTIETNLVATRLIAEVAKGQGISRFIFASTCSVYGASNEILDEHSALNPVSLYARSKIASERVLINLRNDHFSPVILRFGTIYGLSGRTRFDLVVNLLTAKALIDHKITVFGPSQWRPFVHVDDAAKAVLTALEARSELVSDCIFNVGSDEQNSTLGDLGNLIGRLVPRAELVISDGDGDRRDYRVDFRRIREILGFRPSWTIEQGVRQVMQALESNSVTDYRDSKYSNVKFLSEEGAEMLGVRGDWVADLLKPENMHKPTLVQAKQSYPGGNGAINMSSPHLPSAQGNA